MKGKGEYMPTNQILLELSAWRNRAEKAEKELADLKAKPDCTGCVRAKGAEPADVYHGTCFYCCRPDWSNTDHYEAKDKELAEAKNDNDIWWRHYYDMDDLIQSLKKELAGHKRGEEILSEANRQLEKELMRVKSENAKERLEIVNELESLKAENEVLKMTLAHYKGGWGIKF